MPAVSPNVSNPVSAVALDAPKNDINAMLSGYKWGGIVGTPVTVYFSFPTSSNPAYWSQDPNQYGYSAYIDPKTNKIVLGDETETFLAFSAAQQAAATSALQQWANVANITFQKVTETTSAVGDIRFGNTLPSYGAMEQDFYGYTWGLDEVSPSVASPDSGDIWLNRIQPVATGNNYTVGAVGYHTILHEIGHALGIDHSFAEITEENPNDLGVQAGLDFFQYSVMSYDSYYTGSQASSDYGYNEYYPTTLMLLDIQAIQHLYGANMSYRTGNDTYVFNSATKYLQTIWDAGGTDTIQYSSSVGGVINLNEGAFSQLGKSYKVGQNPDPDPRFYFAGVTQTSTVGIAYGAVIENAIGGSGSDTLIGNSANNMLDGGAGVDTLTGGAGSDTYIVDLKPLSIATTAIAAIDLQDEIVETDGTNDALKLRGAATLTNAALISLTADFSTLEHLDISLTGATKFNLTGNGANNNLIGNTANNIIDGGLGADTMIGGIGNDTYLVDNSNDIVTELVNAGTDTVLASASFNLTSLNLANNYVENIQLLAGAGAIDATGNTLANLLNGNESANNLIGLAGADTLDGGAGIDKLEGGDGNDIYIVDNANDEAIEITALVAGGIDLVKSSAANFALSANVENLTLTGADSINGTGNALANIMIGNAGNNQISGGAANDTLTGNAGDDTLNGDEGNDILQGGEGDDTLTGGTGTDVLTGGKGDDTYRIDLIRANALATSAVALQDSVSELASPINTTAEGIDTIMLTNLSGASATAIDFNNITIATTLTIGTNIENMDANETDLIKLNITGNALRNRIVGNNASNILDGAAEVDTLEGGAGDDTYLVDLKTAGVGASAVATLQDSIVESSGIDTVKLRGSAVLTNATTIELANTLTDIEHLDVSLTGITKLNLLGNTNNNKITGNAADNRLDGGFGADTMAGGAGNDTYIIDDANDVVIELAGAGIDTIESFVTFSLDNASANVENITLKSFENLNLVGGDDIGATGNALANMLIGNIGTNTLFGLAGNDTLDGGIGVDTMEGGDGNDVYFVDDTTDRVKETNSLVAGGIDLVRSSANFSLTDFVENLTLINNINGIAESVSGTGNNLANIIIGNAGNNQISGEANNDSLSGESGNDNLLGGLGLDTLNGGLGDDTLTGGAGKDILTGGKGNDTYYVDLIRANALPTSTIALQDTVNELANPLNSTVEGTIDTIILINTSGNAGVLDSAGTPIDSSNITLATTLTVNANVENFDASQALNTNGSGIQLNITGNALVNTIIGNKANNVLDGAGGEDFLFGGFGDDTYLVDLKTIGIGAAARAILQDYVEDGSDINVLNTGGIDTLKLRGAATLTNASYIELGSNLSNIDHIDASATGATLLYLNGNSLNNNLIGNAAANRIEGRDGNDTLDGGAGIDTLIGGDGDDTYVLDAAGDIVNDIFGNDTAIIKFGTSFNLATSVLNAVIENVTLAGAVANLTGNAANNLLKGNDGANIIDGNGGEDIMNGGMGADTYIVDSSGDTVTETFTLALGGGNDLVKSAVDFTLTTNLDNLTLTDNLNLNGGTANINGTGNELANIIIGNAGANTLFGEAGNDTLTANAGDDSLNGDNGNDTLNGGEGNDTLIGGAGVDALTGGKGNDTYYIDLIRTSALATSTIALQDTVNELANIVSTNPATNMVEGIDTIVLTNLTGNAGVVGSAGAPIDTSNLTNVTTLTVNANVENFDASQTGAIKLNIIGNALANIITGNDAANILDGGLNDGKVDTLIGGAGNDTYIVDMVVVGTGAGATFNFIDNISDSDGIDTLKLRGTVNYGTTYIQILNVNDYILLGIEGLDVSLTGATRFNLVGNSADNILIGNAFANTITGDFGNDTLDGGAGNDTLIGGEGNDILNGGTGIDSMDGGSGDDTYIVDNIGDLIQDSGNDLLDTVQSGNVSLNLASYANIDRAILTGTAALNLTGSDTNADSLIGNDGANILDGKAGADYMNGGKGNDVYKVDNFDIVEETYTQANGGGIDLVIANPNSTFTTFTLSENIENLTAIDSVSSLDLFVFNFSVAGNSLKNTIIGNSNNNSLYGYGENDSLSGGAGMDFLSGGDGNDTLNGGTGQDIFVFDNPLNALTNVDTIQGFNTTEDKIRLDGGVFAGIGTVTSSSYFVGTAATNSNHRIINNGGNLYYDTDGVGGVAAVKFASLTGTVGIIGVDDFVIV